MASPRVAVLRGAAAGSRTALRIEAVRRYGTGGERAAVREGRKDFSQAPCQGAPEANSRNTRVPTHRPRGPPEPPPMVQGARNLGSVLPHLSC